ncbi:hypothetical protein ACKVWC_010066 [Pyricularia oryzae]
MLLEKALDLAKEPTIVCSMPDFIPTPGYIGWAVPEVNKPPMTVRFASPVLVGVTTPVLL